MARCVEQARQIQGHAEPHQHPCHFFGQAAPQAVAFLGVDELKRLKPSLAQPDDLVFKVGNFTKSWQSALKLADLPTDWTFRLSAISPRRSWLTPAGPWSPSCRR